MVAFVMIFLFVPETKQRTLEELVRMGQLTDPRNVLLTLLFQDYIFAVPTTKFISYQTGKAAPWW